MLRVNFNIAGEVQYDRAFQVYGEESHNLSEPLGNVADHLVKVVGEQYQTEGAHGLGGKWEPLNPGYDEWKEEHFPGRPMLVRTAQTRQAFLIHGTRVLTEDRLVWGITDQIDEDPDSPGFGERLAIRAEAAQTGAGRQPQRKIVALNAQDRRQIDRLFVDWLSHLKHRAFGGRL